LPEALHSPRGGHPASHTRWHRQRRRTAADLAPRAGECRADLGV